VRTEVLNFIGADPSKQSANLPPDFNRKSTRSKVEFTDAARGALVDFFRDELRACADMFGGAAKKWAAQYGV
jgi:hypothetical protein